MSESCDTCEAKSFVEHSAPAPITVRGEERKHHGWSGPHYAAKDDAIVTANGKTPKACPGTFS